MSSADARQKAEQYINAQAKIIKKYGKAPKLYGAKYKEAVSATMRTFQMMSASREVVAK